MLALVHQVHVDVVFAVHLGHLVAEREDLDGEHGAPDGAGLGYEAVQDLTHIWNP